MSGAQAASAAASAHRLKVVTLVRRFGPLGGGGAERIAREMLMRLDPERFERIIVVSHAPEPGNRPGRAITAELRARGVRVVFLRRRFKYDLFAWWPLLRMLRRERVDVIHAHAFGPNAWAAVIGRIARVGAVVAHEHNWAFEGRRLRPIVDRHVIGRGSDAVLVVSQEARRRMIEQEGIPPERLVLLPNGVHTLPEGDGERIRDELGMPADAPVVGIVCMIRPEKALDVLVHATARLADLHPELRVLIVGDGPGRAGLQQQVREMGLEERVLILGMRSDVPDVLAAFDVAVLCSDFEGIPLSVLEYMDAGRPIVATRVGGIPELIDDGEHGLLVEPRNPSALADAVDSLLRDRPRAVALGARARERCRREFTLDATVERLERLYEELSRKRRDGGGAR